MTNNIRARVVCGTLAGLLAGLLGCRCLIRPAQVSSDGLLAILKEPESQLVPVGTPVTFSVVAIHTGVSTNALSYQWRKNGADIPGATNTTFTIASAAFTDSGQYAVLVTGTSLLSQAASLSVFAFVGNSGTLTMPISTFTSGSGGSSCFPLANGWDRYCQIPGLFHRIAMGPGLPDPDTYPNPTSLPVLKVDTCDTLNGNTLQTGVLIMNDVFITDKACASNAPACTPPNPNPSLTTATHTMATTTTPKMARYKVVVFYKSSTLGTLQNVTVHLNYQ